MYTSRYWILLLLWCVHSWVQTTDKTKTSIPSRYLLIYWIQEFGVCTAWPLYNVMRVYCITVVMVVEEPVRCIVFYHPSPSTESLHLLWEEAASAPVGPTSVVPQVRGCPTSVVPQVRGCPDRMSKWRKERKEYGQCPRYCCYYHCAWRDFSLQRTVLFSITPLLETTIHWYCIHTPM